MTIIQIDGSMLEGGGAIVRNAIALSALYQKSIEIDNIRAKRSKQGLRNQHVHVIKAIGKICNAHIEGVEVGSSFVRFIPGKIESGEYEIDVQTAGSLTLLLQAILPVAAHAPGSVKLLMKGGTDVPMSPPFDYIRYVYLPTMNLLGLNSTICVGRRGHYPRGGGTISCDIEPTLRMKPIQFKFDEKTKVERIIGKAHAVRLPCHIVERMISSANDELKNTSYKIGKIEQECYEPQFDYHIGPGTGITLWAETNHGTLIAGDCLGEKGVPAEEVGKKAAHDLIVQLNTTRPIDFHLADQLIIWMGLSQLPSVIDTSKISLHTLTNIEIVKKFTNNSFEVDGIENSPGVISCEPNL